MVLKGNKPLKPERTLLSVRIVEQKISGEQEKKGQEYRTPTVRMADMDYQADSTYFIMGLFRQIRGYSFNHDADELPKHTCVALNTGGDIEMVRE